MAASFTASGSVGWAWQVRAMSSAEAPNSMASAACGVMLPGAAARGCTPAPPGGVRVLVAGVGAEECRPGRAVVLGVSKFFHEPVGGHEKVGCRKDGPRARG